MSTVLPLRIIFFFHPPTIYLILQPLSLSLRPRFHRLSRSALSNASLHRGQESEWWARGMGKVMQKQVNLPKMYTAIAGMIVQKKNFLSRPNSGLPFCVTIKVTPKLPILALSISLFFGHSHPPQAFPSKNRNLSFNLLISLLTPPSLAAFANPKTLLPIRALSEDFLVSTPASGAEGLDVLVWAMLQW